MSTHTRSRGTLTLPIAGEASIVLVVQFLPMFLLPILDYAWYAGIYLGYAALLAIMFATLADVWARSVRHGRISPEDRSAYYAVLTSITFSAAPIVAVITGLVSWNIGTALIAAAASGLAVFRGGSRYYLIATGSHTKAGLVDILGGTTGLAAAITLSDRGNYTVRTALLLWAATNLVAIVASRATPVFRPSLTRTWFTTNRSTIVTLSSEATIMSLSSTGTPYAVALIVGAPGLALLRAATSLAYPIRLVMSAIRSRIIVGKVSDTTKTIAIVAAFGIAVGAAVAAALVYVGDHALAAGTALSLVSGQPVAVGTLIAATSVSTFLQFNARGRLAPRPLLIRRITHTALILFGTIIAALISGVNAIIWGAALATATTALLWSRADLTVHRDSSPASSKGGP